MKKTQGRKKRGGLQNKPAWREMDSPRPQDYPQRPLSRKNAMLRPIKRS